MDFGTRLGQFVNENFVSVLKFSYRIEIGPSLIHKYINNKSSPGHNVLQKLYEAGCNINWLLSGEGEMWNETEEGKKLKEEHNKKTVIVEEK